MTGIEEAREYVGTTQLSGFAQLALLEQVGVEGTELLEIGCGSLHFMKALLATHRHGIRYSGVDPNVWLRDAAFADDPVLNAIDKLYKPEFSMRDDFDGREAFGRTFDLVFSHSVLSHVGHYGLRRFMAGAANSLRMHGKLLASVNVARVGTQPTIGNEWTYPSGVTVGWAELGHALAENGFDCVSPRPDLRELYMSWCPTETHDWIVAEKVSET